MSDEVMEIEIGGLGGLDHDPLQLRLERTAQHNDRGETDPILVLPNALYLRVVRGGIAGRDNEAPGCPVEEALSMTPGLDPPGGQAA